MIKHIVFFKLAYKLALVFGCPIEEVFIFGKEDGIL